VNKILVTGASGFVGKALVRRLQSASYDVIPLSSKEGDIADPGTLRKYSDERLSRVFHLAARTYVPDSWSDPMAFYQTNVLGTANVLELCKTVNIPVTYVSACLYGIPDRLPIAEDSPIKPNNPYALSKQLAEQLCASYHAMHGIPVTVLRPFNAYGTGQDRRFLIPTIVRQVLFEPAIVVKDLAPRRDFVFLDDLVEALVKTVDHDKGHRVYNIGSGVSHSVGQVVEIAQSIAQTAKKVVCKDMRRSGEIDDVVADISKAQLELNWRPRHSFHDGMEKVIACMRTGARDG
jgi:nucleoside-diphosphate-sugar epimerase